MVLKSRLYNEIIYSQNVIKCKNCKCLMIIKYFGNNLCKECEQEYNNIVNKILNV